MSPIKKKATKKPSKHLCTSSESFWNDDANMAFVDHYKQAPINQEMLVDLDSLEGTFILDVFKERTWTKFLNSMGDVFEDIIREFFANAIMEGDHINCWLRGKEFPIPRESIQDVLEIQPTTPDTSLQYDERKEKLEPLVEILGGQLKKKALHTIMFTPEMRTLAYIMIFNLYQVKNLTTLSGPRTIFLFNLFTHKEIDICSHIYYLFIKSITKSNSRLTLPFLSLVMSLILRARVKISSGLQVIQRKDHISEQTIIRSKAHIPGPIVSVSQIPIDDVVEEGGDTKEEIEHFTSVPEDTAQPFSQAQARAPDSLNHLIRRVKELHVMLALHINHSTSQFTYLEGQITASSFQIDDMMRKSKLKCWRPILQLAFILTWRVKG